MTEELFCAASVNASSHCVTVVNDDTIVYASGSCLVAQSFPECSEHGHVKHISNRHHVERITCVKNIRNTSYVISGCNGGYVNLWEYRDGFHHIQMMGPCNAAALSVSGLKHEDRFVIAVSWAEPKSGFNVYNIDIENNTNEFITTLTPGLFALSIDLKLLPNGSILLAAGTSKKTIELLVENEKSYENVLSVIAHDDWIHAISFNSLEDNILLASAGQDRSVKLWKLSEDDEEESTLQVTRNKFKLPGNKDLWYSLNIEAVLCGHDDWVHSTEWNSTSDKLITSSSDKTVIVWEEVEGLWSDTVRLGIVGGQAAGFYSAAFVKNTGIVASSYFGGLHAWNETDENSAWNALSMTGGHSGEARDISWARNGKYLLSVGSDKTTRLFAKIANKTQYAEISRPQIHGHDMQCICSITSSCFVSGAEEKIFRAFAAPQTMVNSFCNITGFNKDEVFANCEIAEYGAQIPALGLSNKAIEADFVAPEEAHWEEEAFQCEPTELKTCPTEDFLQQNTLWPEIHKLYGHGFEVYAIACNPNKTILATACKASQADHASILLWKISDWSLVNKIEGHQLTVTQIAWNSSGTRLLSVSRDRTAILYKEQDNNLDGHNYVKVWSSNKEHSRIIWSCSWVPNSDDFVTASRDKKVLLWRCQGEGAQVINSYSAEQPVTAVAAGIKNIIACGMQDGSIVIVRMGEAKSEEVERLLVPNIAGVDSAVLRLQFSPEAADSQLLGYAGTDGKVRIFSIPH